MRKLNIDFLIDTPVERLVENIDSFFNDLLQKIESYLNLEPNDYKTNLPFSIICFFVPFLYSTVILACGAVTKSQCS